MTQPTQDGSTSGSETEKIPQKIVKIGSKSSSDDSSKTNMPHSPAYANGKKELKKKQIYPVIPPQYKFIVTKYFAGNAIKTELKEINRDIQKIKDSLDQLISIQNLKKPGKRFKCFLKKLCKLINCHTIRGKHDGK